jgi:hypothetical protein
LIESGSTVSDYRKPDADFFKQFFEESESSLKASSVHPQHYDLFFGCGGTFINGNDNLSLDSGQESCTVAIRHHEYDPSRGLKQALEYQLPATLPIQNGAFVIETNHRYLLATGAGDHFKSQVDECDLDGFLSRVREYFLDYIADEAIRLKVGKHYG